MKFSSNGTRQTDGFRLPDLVEADTRYTLIPCIITQYIGLVKGCGRQSNCLIVNFFARVNRIKWDSTQKGQAVRRNEIFTVADHQNTAAAVLLAKGREVGIVGGAREIDHENIEMAGEEGHHTVGERIPRQK
jgi:hypothetical protein